MTQPQGWGAPQPQQPQRPQQSQGGWPAPGRPGPGGQWRPGPQQPWPAPVPPKKSGGAAKWIIGAVALVAVIAVTIVLTLTLSKTSGDHNGGNTRDTTASAAPTDIASANDKGPVGIITEDPSCAPWGPITNTLADVEGKGWRDRDPSIPASSWTPEVRAQYEAVGAAWRQAADQIVPLAKMTPHRVMRELYEQAIVNMRIYADRIANYTPVDDGYAKSGVTASLVITYTCGAVRSGAAAARASLIPPQAPPQTVAPVGDPSNPALMFTTPDPVCSELNPTLDQLLQNPVFKDWLKTDPKIPVTNWPPEQKSLTDALVPVMSSTAQALENLANKSSNPIVRDFILLGVQYRRTYLRTLPTYQPDDDNIYAAGQYAPGVILGVCTYAAG